LAIVWFWDVEEVGEEELDDLPLAEVGVPVLPSFAPVSAASSSLAASATGFSDDCDMAALEEVEGDVTELELKLDKLVKLCIAMIDTGKAFCAANKQFMNGIRDLAQYSSKDTLVETSLTKFSDTLQEITNYHNILFDQAQRSIKAQLQTFVKEDIRKFKDAKKQFEKVSEEKENALVKNAQVQRNKQHEVEEATNILTAARKCFRHIALDYVLQ
ncbi:PREDICTED: arf-GAP with coiled-coil, ANK repeat and PH domain-containing protein 2-like, partial [Acanthisitta chloris]|uniref:arf-GAP with coiled-coil, ANK repeat and PH domain-containing protein 2-like n=1 Tax=Acanthisitta chloris TaxID=57068 RepID=UPI0004F0FD50